MVMVIMETKKICGFRKPSAFPHQLLDAVGLNNTLAVRNHKMLLNLMQGMYIYFFNLYFKSEIHQSIK